MCIVCDISAICLRDFFFTFLCFFLIGDARKRMYHFHLNSQVTPYSCFFPSKIWSSNSWIDAACNYGDFFLNAVIRWLIPRFSILDEKISAFPWCRMPRKVFPFTNIHKKIMDIHGKQESVSTDSFDHGFRSAARIVCRHRSTIF